MTLRFRTPLRYSRKTKRSAWRLIFGAAIIMAPATHATADNEPSALNIVLNGRATGIIGEFIWCSDELCASAIQWGSLGLLLPPNLLERNTPIRLSEIPNVSARLDGTTQTFYIGAAESALIPSLISGQSMSALVPLSASAYGAVINYDVLGSFSNVQRDVSGLFALRAFSPHGLVETTAVVNLHAASGPNNVIRLNTTYSYANPDRMLRLRLGDVITGALSWNRAFRLGGLQISSDFNLRPDLISYPLPMIRSSTAVPATVSLMANGAIQARDEVRPGPFSAQIMPVISGAGEVSIAVQDELGRQTVITLPVYASSELLRPELMSYALEAGFIRENYGSHGDHYARWAASGSVRRGFTDWLTLEAHGETDTVLASAGIGAVAKIGTIGIVNAALSGSVQHGNNRQYGHMFIVGAKRTSRRFNVGLNATFYTKGYRDITTNNYSSLPKSTLTANVGYSVDGWGGLGISYIARNAYTALQDKARLRARDDRFRILNATYTAPATRFGSFYVNGYKYLLDGKSYGVSAGFSFFFGGHTSASLGTSWDGRRATQSFSVAQSALEPHDFGYRVQTYQGSSARRNAEVEYLSPSGSFSAGIGNVTNAIMARIGARGALAFAAGKVFVSSHIDDSFAVVSTGGVGNVPVQYEHRPIGRTNAAGFLLVPALLSYQNNRLSFDASDLPPDVIVGQTFAVVRPQGGAAAKVDFEIGRLRAALVRFRDKQDRPIPLGAMAQIEGQDPQAVGYDGEAYLSGLSADNIVTVMLPNGTFCKARFAYHPVAGDIPNVDRVVCQ